MFYREIMAVCSEIHTKHINKLRGQNVELWMLNWAVKQWSATHGPWEFSNISYAYLSESKTNLSIDSVNFAQQLSKQYLKCNELRAVAAEQPNLETLQWE
jgi:hypothetical protein